MGSLNMKHLLEIWGNISVLIFKDMESKRYEYFCSLHDIGQFFQLPTFLSLHVTYRTTVVTNETVQFMDVSWLYWYFWKTVVYRGNVQRETYLAVIIKFSMQDLYDNISKPELHESQVVS